MRTRQPIFGRAAAVAGLLVVAMAATAPAGQALAQQGGQPQDFEQILPRGRIASIDQPVFVEAAAAKVLPESWVLGVMIDGQARAFSLAVLNSHEIVNDSIGDTNYAAVW
jgi:hypothetical protein